MHTHADAWEMGFAASYRGTDSPVRTKANRKEGRKEEKEEETVRKSGLSRLGIQYGLRLYRAAARRMIELSIL